jgi:hypothetical protein
LRQAVRGAKNIVAAIRGGRKIPFTFNTLGQLAAIGRRTGVADVFGIKISGLPAWILWRTIYLAKLPSFEKKLRVMLGWMLDLFFPRNFVQVLTVQRIDHIARRLAYIREHPTFPVPGNPIPLPVARPVENSPLVLRGEQLNEHLNSH